MVKSRKNNLHLEVSNDVDLEYETALTTSRRSRKEKGKTLTTTKKVSLKAKPKKSGSYLVVNGKKIPLTNSKKSRRNKMSSKTKGAKKASSSSMPFANDKKVSFDVKEEKAQGSNSLQSSSTGSESAGTKTIYMPIKQEADGQTAEAIIVEDKKKVDLQDVKLVEAKTKKKD